MGTTPQEEQLLGAAHAWHKPRQQARVQLEKHCMRWEQAAFMLEMGYRLDTDHISELAQKTKVGDPQR